MTPMTSARRPAGVRAADAFETVAWRPPSSARFDTRVANDVEAAEPTLTEAIAGLPGWVVPLIGAAVAALVGLLLGGFLAI